MDPFAKKMVFGALVFGSAMVLMAAALSVVYFHLYPRCSEQVMAEVTSPNREWTAAVMERRCGPESPYLLHVNLRQAGNPILLGYFSGKAGEGEVLVVEEETAGTVPDLEWTAPRQLTIRCPRCSSAFAQRIEERFGNVLVRYQTN